MSNLRPMPPGTFMLQPQGLQPQGFRPIAPGGFVLPPVTAPPPANKVTVRKDPSGPLSINVWNTSKLIEEEPLPPHHNPGGIYENHLEDKRRRDIDAKAIRPIPTKSVGSFRDHPRLQRFCKCKPTPGTRCLRLYCECFAAGIHCSNRCNCGTCDNISVDTTMARVRRRALLDHLAKYPDAFRPIPSAQCGKSWCKCYQDGIYCDVRVCRCPACHGIPPDYKRYAQSGMLPGTSDTSVTYAIPMAVGGKIFPGLAFARKDPGRVIKRPAERSPSSKRLFHNLMLSPSKKLDQAKEPEQKAGEFVGTELEQQLQAEVDKANKFFSVMREKAAKPKDDMEEVARDSGKQDEVTERANKAFDVVTDDMTRVVRVVEAAKVDIMTRLYEERRKRVKMSIAPEDSDTPYDDEKELVCHEKLGATPNIAGSPQDPDAMKNTLAFAAQDTALLRETARIIRRKARELAERRAKST